MKNLAGWVGKTRVQHDVLGLFPARGLAATLDRDSDVLEEGVPLPRGWHWLYFHHAVRRSALGTEGHERLGAFLPPVPLPRRMWAGGRLTFTGDLRLGESALRRSTVESIQEKTGRSGRLVFVTVRHQVEGPRGLAVDEEQHLVYRELSGAEVTPVAPPVGPAWSEDFTADEVTLFRFSALTFNGHRIHYDYRYATSEEGYPGLVVHGPLLALLLLDACGRQGDPPPSQFSYRAQSPLFAGETFRLEGGRMPPRGGAGEAEAWVAGSRGVAMRATVGW